jgi:hypothetical protein
MENDFLDTVRRVSSVLDTLGLRYHLTGGIASSFYGEPRLTQDIDIVIKLDEKTVEHVLAGLAQGFITSDQAARDAVAQRKLFQALDRKTSLKLDFHTACAIPGELDRSIRTALVSGLSVPLVSKEDAIVSKLRWIQMGSAKSRDDVRAMLIDQTTLVDQELLLSLAKQLGVEALLREIEGSLLG